MIIYPAIDIKGGKCVRLTQGKFDDVTVYCDEPYKIAAEFVKKGAEFVHTVDLDGAKEGKRINAKVISDITAHCAKIPVQLGGGIRDMKAVEEAFELGISRVIIGTAATENPDFVKEAVEKYGDKIAVGIDAKDGYAATHGWEKVSTIKAVELAKQMEKCGVSTIIYTDIATDGMLKGPNIKAMCEMVEALETCKVIASGGVSSMEDIYALRKTGVAGVIVGKAIYSGNINLDELLSK